MDQPHPSRNSPASHPNLPADGSSEQTDATSHTSLPSIHHLHQYLPRTGMYQSLPTGTQYTYPAPQQNPSSSEGRGSFDRATVSPEANREDPAGAGNSEPDEQGPPKKKRRRQALSCTECKRRKIKCDRAQPCGPCTRRNEQSKCQWNIIEPTDKTVPRGEFDELKAKFDELKASFDDLKARHDRLESAVARIPTPLFASQLPGPSSHYMTTSPIGASSSSHLTAGIPSHPAMVSAARPSHIISNVRETLTTLLGRNNDRAGLAGAKKIPSADVYQAAGQASAPVPSSSSSSSSGIPRRPNSSYSSSTPLPTSSSSYRTPTDHSQLVDPPSGSTSGTHASTSRSSPYPGPMFSRPSLPTDAFSNPELYPSSEFGDPPRRARRPHASSSPRNPFPAPSERSRKRRDPD